MTRTGVALAAIAVPPVTRYSVTYVSQGGFHVTSRRDEFLSTLLGSCVAVCARDPVARLGGMNHFVLPSSGVSRRGCPDLALRYGSYSIERLINEILAAGGERGRLEIKVFGGARMFEGSSGIGDRNSRFVESYLAAEGFRIAAADLGGGAARKVRYLPATGQAWVRRLSAPARGIFLRERAIAPQHLLPASAGEVVLFQPQGTPASGPPPSYSDG